MKIRSERYFFSGMSYTAKVEQSTDGSGDNGYPTKITIHSDESGNYFDVNGNPGIDTIEIISRGEWEASILGDVFEWIGKELNKIHRELKDGE